MDKFIGEKVPNFISSAIDKNGNIIENYDLYKNTKNKKILLFFYPLNFTFVCPSELIALNKKVHEFQKKNIEVIAISVDSHFSHLAWRNKSIEDGGIGEVRFTLLSDVSQKIMKLFKVNTSNGIAYRGTFIIDENKIIRSFTINDLPIGRNIDEIIRIFDAIEFLKNNSNKVCPVNWKIGKDSITANKEGIAKFLKNNINNI